MRVAAPYSRLESCHGQRRVRRFTCLLAAKPVDAVIHCWFKEVELVGDGSQVSELRIPLDRRIVEEVSMPLCEDGRIVAPEPIYRA